MRKSFLIDTKVISETRKAHPNAGVTAFFRGNPGRTLFLSVLTIGELRKGAAMQRKSRVSFADRLSTWIDGLESAYGDRILNVDVQVAQAWGEMASDRSRPIIDTLLLATAVSHDLAFVTRNTIDAHGTAAHVINPFE